MATTYVAPLFDPAQSSCAICCHPSKVDEIKDEFSRWVEMPKGIAKQRRGHQIFTQQTVLFNLADNDPEREEKFAEISPGNLSKK